MEGQPEERNCHYNCESEEMVTAVEVFILTAVYSCIALRFFTLKRRKHKIERAELEAENFKEKNERIEKQKR